MRAEKFISYAKLDYVTRNIWVVSENRSNKCKPRFFHVPHSITRMSEVDNRECEAMPREENSITSFQPQAHKK